MTRSSRPCPVCESTIAEAVYDNRVSAIDGLNLGYRVALCTRCGFVFADRLASPHTYDLYYRTLSKYDVIADVGAVSAIDRRRAEIAVAMCAPYLPTEAHVADLGCGAGVLLDAFCRAGWKNLSGLDPAPAASEQARRLFGLEGVKTGTLADAPKLLPLANLDFVCLTGVLEHLPCLREDLLCLTSTLSQDAKLLLEVPALERFNRAPREPFGEFSLEHIQFFSATSLTGLLATAGYSPVALQIVDLPAGHCDSLLGLFARTGKHAVASLPAESGDISSYVRSSEADMQEVIQRVLACPAERLVIYGAGSHTTRLLPRLLDAGLARTLLAVLDSNPNLLGKSLGPLIVESPESLAKYPDATVIISSFRSQEEIAAALSCRFANPLLRLYP